MKNNLKEIKTTGIGASLFLLAFAWFAVNFKTLNAFAYEDLYVPGGIGVVGIAFLVAPDKILNWAFRKAKEKTGQS